MEDVPNYVLPRPLKCGMAEDCIGVPKWYPCIYFGEDKNKHLMLGIGCCEDHKTFNAVEFAKLNAELLATLGPLIDLDDTNPENAKVFYERIKNVPEA